MARGSWIRINQLQTAPCQLPIFIAKGTKVHKMDDVLKKYLILHSKV
jgi:hypothetical protein